MRSLYLFFLMFFLLNGSLLTQAQKKTVLVEHFTNTRCPICKNNNPGFYTRFNKYKEDAIHIAYHPSIPYDNCAFYVGNKEGNGSRQAHYAIVGTPTAFINGKSGSANLLTDNDYVNAIAEQPKYALEFSSALSSEVAIKLITLSDLPDGKSFQVFAALTENVVEYAAPNGETQHYDVFRKFIGNYNNGQTYTFPAGTKAGDFQVLSFGGVLHGIPDWNDFTLVTFMNETGQKEILQAARTIVNSTASSNNISNNKIQLTSYPNPVKEELSISWTEPSFKPENITIFTTEGNMIHNYKITVAGMKAHINVSDLAPGIYLYKLYTNEELSIAQGKFIVK